MTCPLSSPVCSVSRFQRIRSTVVPRGCGSPLPISKAQHPLARISDRSARLARPSDLVRLSPIGTRATSCLCPVCPITHRSPEKGQEILGPSVLFSISDPEVALGVSTRSGASTTATCSDQQAWVWSRVLKTPLQHGVGGFLVPRPGRCAGIAWHHPAQTHKQTREASSAVAQMRSCARQPQM